MRDTSGCSSGALVNRDHIVVALWRVGHGVAHRPQLAYDRAVNRIATVVACVAVPAIASAGKLTLDPGGLFVQLDVEMNVSSGTVLKPVSIAPDVSVGVTPELTLSLVNSTFGTTGFRGGTGDGLCVTGTTGGCPHVYNNVGGEAVYSLVEGDVAVAAVGGVYSLNIDGSFVDLKLGAKTKITQGVVTVLFNPSIYAGMNHRATNADQLYLPLGIAVKVAPPLSVGLGTGIKGPLANFSSFGAKYTIPLGINGVVTFNPMFAIGASFTFGKLVGGPELPADSTGTAFRGVHVWLNYTH
jgi:hypothetical protein